MKLLCFVVGAVLALFTFESSAQAGYRHHQRPHHQSQSHQATGFHPDCNILFPCELPSRTPVLRRQATAPAAFSWFSWPKGKEVKTRSPSKGINPRGLVAPLASKVAAIVADCGSKLISGVRHTFVAGTHRISLHAFGEAADVSGNPSCIYSMLQGWPGGYSTDYGRMHHVHISYEPGGREWGTRFVHGGGGHHRHYAHHRHHLSFMS